MNRERLQQMVTMLRELPEDKRHNFDLTDWHCGTSACAVGHACLDPVFIAQGLRLIDFYPEFMGNEGWSAVKAFFGLERDDAEHLFELNAYSTRVNTTPNQVADRIESFLAREV